MKIGTRSVLYGVHQFFLHPYLVAKAWRLVYGVRPSWQEMTAIILHDIGYFGCPNMDGEEGIQHPARSATVAKIFGRSVVKLVLFHSRTFARSKGEEVSPLCLPDKLATLLYPRWVYLFAGRLSGEITEYKGRMGMAHLDDAEWLDIIQMNAYLWALGEAQGEVERRVVLNFRSRLPHSRATLSHRAWSWWRALWNSTSPSQT